ncbi:hypothetical protein Trydic_g17735 [Trypoxylus dichotomus]
MQSSSATIKVKNVSSNAEILNNTCPEIFETSPRPGGFLKVMVPTRSQDYMVDACTCPTTEHGSIPRKSAVSLGSSRFDRSTSFGQNLNSTLSAATSREFRIKRAIEEADWELTAVDETETVVGISSILQDTINMLAVSVSCVMLMAADLPVPEDYLVWAQTYLQSIKDEDEMNPPNIQGIIGEIIKRRDPSYVPSAASENQNREKSSKSLTKTPSTKEKSKSKTSSHDRNAESNTLTAEKPN